MVLPDFTRRTQYGAVLDGPAAEVLLPLVDVLRWKDIPLPGVTTVMAWIDPAVSDWRTITPAFAQLLVFVSEATRAMISTSPDTG